MDKFWEFLEILIVALVVVSPFIFILILAAIT